MVSIECLFVVPILLVLDHYVAYVFWSMLDIFCSCHPIHRS